MRIPGFILTMASLWEMFALGAYAAVDPSLAFLESSVQAQMDQDAAMIVFAQQVLDTEPTYGIPEASIHKGSS